jgi:hypothetical protein
VSGIGLLAAFLIVVIALAAVYFILPRYSAGNSTITQRGGAEASNATPQALQSALSSGTNNYANVSELIGQKVNSTPEFVVNYSGSVTFGSSALSFLTISVPFTFGYEKYYNDSRTATDVQGIPLIGNVSTVTIVNRGVGTYNCARAGGARFECSGSNYTASNLSSNTTLPFNTTLVLRQFSNLSLTKGLRFTDIGHTYYGGQGCTLVALNGTLELELNKTAKSGASNQTYNMEACLSDQYYVPLSINGTTRIGAGNSTITVSIDVHETNIGQSASLDEVVTLPGPIVNTSTNT